MALSVEDVHSRSAQAVHQRVERQRLQLQRMERSLVRARLAQPAAMPREDYECLRYALGMARLHRFRPHGANADVTVNSRYIAPLRHWLLDNLQATLRDTSIGAVQKLSTCREAVPEVRGRVTRQRHRLLKAHADDFGPEALDREAGQRALVTVAGGGGGAGFVYVGAMTCLRDHGFDPDYIVGNSMGSVLGTLRATRRDVDLDDLLTFGRGLKNGDVFSTARRRRAEFCIPGMLELHLKAMHERLRVGGIGRPLRLGEMEIPLDIVVAGVRRRPYSRLPEEVRRPMTGSNSMLPLPLRVAGRLSLVMRYFNSDLVEPVVLGRDRDTRRIHAVDAAGFSAAVPTLLHYEPGPAAGMTRGIFSELLNRRELAGLVDGGVADNVPVHSAWNGVAEGRVGTRNAYYLAFDCFQPRVDFKNIWLWPIMQSVQMQMRDNRPYADMLIQFDPTLSPLNIVPGATGIDYSFAWGYSQMQARMPEVREMMRPVSLMQQTEKAVPA